MERSLECGGPPLRVFVFVVRVAPVQAPPPSRQPRFFPLSLGLIIAPGHRFGRQVILFYPGSGKIVRVFVAFAVSPFLLQAGGCIAQVKGDGFGDRWPSPRAPHCDKPHRWNCSFGQGPDIRRSRPEEYSLRACPQIPRPAGRPPPEARRGDRPVPRPPRRTG